MIPSLHRLEMPTQTVGMTKRDREDEIYFKAYKPGRYRELSNLFGPVEWAYQRAKFKEGSLVYSWLTEGEEKSRARTWTRGEFDAARAAMKHTGKSDSYVTPDGYIAAGLLAQFTSQIAKDPTSLLARQRLAHIYGRKFSEKDAEQWHAQNVNPPLSDEDKYAFMLQLLRDKYSTDEYNRNLLISTGSLTLHEARGRGAPGDWAYQPLTEKGKEKGFDEGKDWLGQLLMKVRGELTT